MAAFFFGSTSFWQDWASPRPEPQRGCWLGVVCRPQLVLRGGVERSGCEPKSKFRPAILHLFSTSLGLVFTLLCVYLALEVQHFNPGMSCKVLRWPWGGQGDPTSLPKPHRGQKRRKIRSGPRFSGRDCVAAVIMPQIKGFKNQNAEDFPFFHRVFTSRAFLWQRTDEFSVHLRCGLQE